MAPNSKAKKLPTARPSKLRKRLREAAEGAKETKASGALGALEIRGFPRKSRNPMESRWCPDFFRQEVAVVFFFFFSG